MLLFIIHQDSPKYCLGGDQIGLIILNGTPLPQEFAQVMASLK